MNGEELKNNEKNKKNSSLPGLRINTELYEKIKKAKKDMNSTFSKEIGMEINLPTFRRMALKNFSEKILNEEEEFSITYKA